VRKFFGFLGLSLLVGFLVQSPAMAGGDEVYSRVKQHFSDWDLNHDGRLDDQELSLAIQRSDIRAEDAAALAALKHFSAAAPFTLDSLQHNQDSTGRIGARTIPFAKYYDTYVTKIQEASRDLFASGVPHRESIRQGPRGDCYFLAAVGALLSRSPHDVSSLLQTRSDGSFAVSFPGRPVIRVSRPTDAQIALYTSSAKDGLWLFALEKAFGDVSASEGYRPMVESLDATSSGGDPGYSIRILTGHKNWRFDINGGQSRGDEDRLNRVRLIRERLAEAYQMREVLVVSSQTNGLLPGGVAPQHAYALIGFNPSRDEVTLWNPWGKTFTPSRESQGSFLEQFATDHGVFTVPLDKLWSYWRALSGETL
jgi:hypothetical protein